MGEVLPGLDQLLLPFGPPSFECCGCQRFEVHGGRSAPEVNKLTNIHVTRVAAPTLWVVGREEGEESSEDEGLSMARVDRVKPVTKPEDFLV